MKEIKGMIIFCCLLFLSLGVENTSAKNNDNKKLSYEVVCAGSASKGNYLVTVTGYVDKKSDINIDHIRKCAVHGIIFEGVVGGAIPGCTSQKAMMSPSQEYAHTDFFNSFFRNDYLRYATAIDPSIKTVKVGKKYAITATIEVHKDALRKYLEEAGIINKLGF